MRGKANSFWVAVFIVCFAILGASKPSAAQQNQSVATLASFDRMEGFHYPGPLVQAADGSFFGTSCNVVPSLFPPTTYGYGGTLFQLAPDGSLMTIVSFPAVHSENQLGWGPISGVVQDDEGNFYGTTYWHGATDDTLAGMVYKVTTAGELVVLHYFSGGDDGSKPHADQLARGNDGSFYGTTAYGGMGDNGTVYRITPDGDFTTLYRFTGAADGANPFSSLIQAGDGDFYGTTVTGGANGGGTIFRITQDGQLTPLYSFAEGDSAFAGLVQAADGNFYGRTVNTLGGATIFQLTPGGDFNTIYAFPSGTDDEVHSVALTPGNDGRLYGSTGGGGPPHYGTIFAITGDGVLTTLFYFNDTAREGAFPSSHIRLAQDGNFYGTTSGGGANGKGTIFAIAPLSSLTTLHNFVDPEGRGPLGILQATDGKFYGATGTSPLGVGLGTLFSLTTDGALTTLHTFTGADGRSPNNGLIQASDGSFYGTTWRGESGDQGVVYKMGVDGNLTSLYTFPGGIGGANPTSGVIQGSDGNLYGTAYNGGVNNAGMIFQLTLDGSFTGVHSFDGTDGANPFAALLQASDGNFYGTTTREGGFGQVGGTVFQMTPSGGFTTLHAFDASRESPSPEAKLVEGNDGALWGTTFGQYIRGRVFRITTDGMLANIHSLDNSEGDNPIASLLLASDGNLYGITGPGGSTIAGAGIIFKVTPNGMFLILHRFDGTDGAGPYYGALIEGTDGFLYGVTGGGGSSGNGTFFRFEPGR